jgi:hypothetical protein
VLPLPAQSGTSFIVQWTGQDNPGGSGIAGYDIYVSHNGATYAAWLVGTTNDSAVFTGASGDSYSFYSIAHDNVGNVEQKTPTAEAQTTLSVLLSLHIALTNGLVQVSWPTSAANYVLQTVPALNGSSNWRTVTNRPSIAGSQFVLTLSALDAARYYRLYARPELTIQWSNSQVMLSWPKSATDFRLVTATNLVSAMPWQATSYTPLTNADQNVLIVPPTNPSRYYRLVTP